VKPRPRHGPTSKVSLVTWSWNVLSDARVGAASTTHQAASQGVTPAQGLDPRILHKVSLAAHHERW